MIARRFPRYAVFVACALVCLLPERLALAETRLPAESQWTWIHIGPLFDRWESITGKATISVQGTRFSAKLFDADYPSVVRFTVTGALTGEKLTARVVRGGSDVGPSNYSGTIGVRTFDGFGDTEGVQTILLRDEFQQVLGLTRTLKRQK